MKKCDVIIPIYNAYDCLKSCIDSVINNTDFSKDSYLILIDDKSPDKRVLPLLKKYQKDYSYIKLIENEKNLGFVGSVNKGMKESKNDVVLLNSDTEVTKDWLKKMSESAYSDNNIATVTPLSNNATLVSVPTAFVPNTLPKGMSLKEMANVVEKCAYNENREVLTGHGFCLLIKREVLEEVGYFDEEGFGRGYGEENDFCFRCLDHGYRNVICDNTYILHKESQSFSDDKKELIEEGLEEIRKRYPDYKKELDKWCQSKEICYIGENVAMNLGTTTKKPNVLFIIHDWGDIRKNMGGTSLHAWDIICKLRNKFNFHVLSPEGTHYKVYSYWNCYEAESSISFPSINTTGDYQLYNIAYKKMLDQILQLFKINIVHVHHYKDNYFDMVNLFKKYNIYSVITLHDYYAVCPTINKLYKNETYCENPTLEKCQKCLVTKKVKENRTINIINSWRKNNYEFLKSFDKIITPSEAAKQEILMTYKDLNITVIEHGIDIIKDESVLKLNDDKNDVAFVGAIGIHKGRNILTAMIKSKKLKSTRIHLFGKLYNPIKQNKKYIDHGVYKREELKQLLKDNDIKLVCLFSTWPETYSYTLTECIASGIPVISFDFGAIAERIKKYKLGWLIPANSSVDDIMNKIEEIFNDKAEYNVVINSINKYKIKTVAEMTKDYDNIYSKNINNEIELVDKEELKKLIRNSRYEYTDISYQNYSWVFDTLKWKLISKIKLPKFMKRKQKIGDDLDD